MIIVHPTGIMIILPVGWTIIREFREWHAIFQRAVIYISTESSVSRRGFFKFCRRGSAGEGFVGERVVHECGGPVFPMSVMLFRRAARDLKESVVFSSY